MLIGNKCDCERKVDVSDANKFAEEHGLKYLETSAKSDKNLRKAIACLLKKIIESKESEKSGENKEKKEIKRSFLSLYSDDNDSPVNIKKFRRKNCGCLFKKIKGITEEYYRKICFLIKSCLVHYIHILYIVFILY